MDRMKEMKRTDGNLNVIALGLILGLLAAACGPGPTSTPEPPELATVSPPASYTPQAVSPMPTERSMETPPPGHIPPQEDLVVDQVVADLAARLEIASSAVEILALEDVVWPDASLGCPAPGKMYAQVETPGWLITLRAEDKTYSYHADQRGNYVLCQDGEPLEPLSQQEGHMHNQTVQQAIADLASRLDVAESQIELVSLEEVTWRDGSLGCPEPGRAYTQALVNGSRIVLEADDRQWHYHSGGGREPFLCLTPQEPLETGSEPGNGAGDY